MGGGDDARARVVALLDGLQRLSVDDLGRLSLPAGDRPERVAARERALEIARQTGRTQLVEDAAAEARELVIRAFAGNQYQPTWAGLQWGRSLGSAQDRVNLIAAVEDAALAEVVGDEADPDDIAVLGEPYRTLASMRTTYPDLALPRGLSSHVVAGVLIALGLTVAVAVLGLVRGGDATSISLPLPQVILVVIVISLWRLRSA
jgi:hypothetical protein